jgi:hypothetical protein
MGGVEPKSSQNRHTAQLLLPVCIQSIQQQPTMILDHTPSNAPCIVSRIALAQHPCRAQNAAQRLHGRPTGLCNADQMCDFALHNCTSVRSCDRAYLREWEPLRFQQVFGAETACGSRRGASDANIRLHWPHWTPPEWIPTVAAEPQASGCRWKGMSKWNSPMQMREW